MCDTVGKGLLTFFCAALGGYLTFQACVTAVYAVKLVHRALKRPGRSEDVVG